MGADAVVKAAKKALKREESGSMKIKHLTKSLLEKWDSSGSGSFDKNEVRRCIEESELFVVDGKVVALKKKAGGGVNGDKKRKSSAEKDNGESVKDGSATTEEADRKAAKKAAKRAKKETKNAGKTTTASATTTAASSSGNESSIQTWRTQHKIVLRDSRNGEEGATATKSIVSNEDYHPYQTFDAPGCREKILGELISHCTVANAFARPTPIQAQCWPVLLSCDSKTGRHRDAVGIAETGSGKGAPLRIHWRLRRTKLACSWLSLVRAHILHLYNIRHRRRQARRSHSQCRLCPSCPGKDRSPTSPAVRPACSCWPPRASWPCNRKRCWKSSARS
jgi:hypothetical protein